MAGEQSTNPMDADVAMSFIHQLSARINMLEAALASTIDDYPEQDDAAPAGAETKWDGKAVNFYGGNLLTVDITDPSAILGKYICYHTGLEPTKHASGVWPKGVSSGAWYWDTSVRGSPWMSWEVAEEVPDSSPTEYRLVAGKTCGTIRIPVPIPTEKYQVIQLGAGTGASTTDNGVLANYVRTH